MTRRDEEEAATVRRTPPPLLSVQQQAAVDWVTAALLADGRRHLLLDAVAGAGKTHTLVAMVRAVHAVRPDARVLLLAFNTAMADAGPQPHTHNPGGRGPVPEELRQRLAATAEVHTVHAFGLAMCSGALGGPDHQQTGGGKRRCRRCEVDPDKAHRLWRQWQPGDEDGAVWARVRPVVDRWRQEGRAPTDDPATVMMDASAEDVELVRGLLGRMLEERDVVDQGQGSRGRGR